MAAKGICVWGELKLAIYDRCLPQVQPVQVPSLPDMMMQGLSKKVTPICFQWNNGHCVRPLCSYVHAFLALTGNQITRGGTRRPGSNKVLSKTTSAPKKFSAVADALLWILNKRGIVKGLYYLDDFVQVARNMHAALRQKQVLLSTFESLQVPIGSSKLEGPAT